MNSAPVETLDLPLPPSTTLADALNSYRDFKKPLSIEPSYFAHLNGAAPWALHHDSRSAELRALVKEQAAELARDAAFMVAVGDFKRELFDLLPTMENRRQIAHSMGKRLKSVAPLTKDGQARDLTTLPEQMFLCRVDGHAGLSIEGNDRRFAFAYKCGSTRFCPDCAREHSMYEAQRYALACMEHVARGPAYRAYQLVFTRPSVPVGSMLAGVNETQAMLRKFFDATRPCMEADRARYGWGPRKKKLRTWQPGQEKRTDVVNGKRRVRYDGEGIHGMLSQLECHLTARGQWHPHLNVLVLTKGDFTFEKVRQVWGFNVECRPIVAGPEGFARAFAELIKYPFRHVAEKNQDKRDAGETDAPPFELWPDAAVIEWHAATRNEVPTCDGSTRVQGARWLRSYGSLHGIPPPECELQATRWVAPLTFSDDGRYFVGSILGSKFPNSARKTQDSGYRVPTIRPPPPRNRPPGEP